MLSFITNKIKGVIMNINRTKQGFTLAETLITLIVIGVISSLTIPTLNANSREKTYVSGLNKAYTDITAATSALEIKYGPLQYWDWSDQNKIMDMYGEQFSFIESKGTTRITQSGMSWYIYNGNNGNNEGLGSGGMAIVDVNTNEQQPNQNGVDRFAFRIEPDKVVPYGADGIGEDSEYAATYTVLQTGKIPKKKKK